ncbi:MAG: hypothetical protein IJW67_00620 [Blautia sp.]|nr:hypothetical protein [Blautia sp.]
MNDQELYHKFLETKQEPVRLDAALQGYFSESASSEQREAYGAYLQRRIRPAVEKLIRQGAIEKIASLEQLGWFREKELDHFIELAMQAERYPVLIWLQRLKSEKYGYQERNFSL